MLVICFVHWVRSLRVFPHTNHTFVSSTLAVASFLTSYFAKCALLCLVFAKHQLYSLQCNVVPCCVAQRCVPKPAFLAEVSGCTTLWPKAGLHFLSLTWLHQGPLKIGTLRGGACRGRRLHLSKGPKRSSTREGVNFSGSALEPHFGPLLGWSLHPPQAPPRRVLIYKVCWWSQVRRKLM